MYTYSIAFGEHASTAASQRTTETVEQALARMIVFHRDRNGSAIRSIEIQINCPTCQGTGQVRNSRGNYKRCPAKDCKDGITGTYTPQNLEFLISIEQNVLRQFNRGDSIDLRLFNDDQLAYIANQPSDWIQKCADFWRHNNTR